MAGLSLITAAIVHWNTVNLDRAVQRLRAQGAMVPDEISWLMSRSDGSRSA